MDSREIFEADRLMTLLGVELLEGRPGHVCLRYVVQENIVQRHGICHGGVIFSLADAACGIAANSAERAAVTQTCSISFLKPAPVGTVLIATAREKSRSGRTVVMDVDVTDEDGNAIADLRGITREIRPRL